MVTYVFSTSQVQKQEQLIAPIWQTTPGQIPVQQISLVKIYFSYLFEEMPAESPYSHRSGEDTNSKPFRRGHVEE